MNLSNLEKVLSTSMPETERKVELVMSILDRIHELLSIRFNGRQKELAAALGISEAAVSKMLNGYQNFSIETIARLEAVFGKPILAVCTSEPDADDYIAVRTSDIITTTMQISQKGLEFAEQAYNHGHTTITHPINIKEELV